MIRRYLRERFLTAYAFAQACGIGESELSQLIERGLVPRPAYETNDEGGIASFVFGTLPAPGVPAGRWFNPHSVHWVARAREALAASDGDAQDASALLRSDFHQRYLSALRASHAEQGPIPGFSDAAGNFDEAAFDEQFPGIWEHFLAGTYGLCVAQPSSEAHIVAKEATQARLTHVTANGTRRNFSDREKAEVRELIGRYEVLSMPFSPAEYPRSSRKRLIEDMLPHVAADPMRVEAPTP